MCGRGEGATVEGHRRWFSKIRWDVSRYIAKGLFPFMAVQLAMALSTLE